MTLVLFGWLKGFKLMEGNFFAVTVFIDKAWKQETRLPLVQGLGKRAWGSIADSPGLSIDPMWTRFWSLCWEEVSSQKRREILVGLNVEVLLWSGNKNCYFLPILLAVWFYNPWTPHHVPGFLQGASLALAFPAMPSEWILPQGERLVPAPPFHSHKYTLLIMKGMQERFRGSWWRAVRGG